MKLQAHAEHLRLHNSRGLALAGDWCRADTTAAVVMATDLRAHRRWRDRYPQIQRRLLEDGISSLAFDYAGCGGSDDCRVTTAGLVDDLHCVVLYCRELGFRKLALWGHGVLGPVCILAQTGVDAVVLTGAAAGPVDYDWGEELGEAEWAAVQAQGVVTVPTYDPAVRKEQVIDMGLLLDLANMDQEQLLARLVCPLLMVNGGDEKNVVETARRVGNAQAQRLLGDLARHSVIEGAPHSFAGHVDELATLTAEWLAAALTGRATA